MLPEFYHILDDGYKEVKIHFTLYKDTLVMTIYQFPTGNQYLEEHEKGFISDEKQPRRGFISDEKQPRRGLFSHKMIVKAPKEQ